MKHFLDKAANRLNRSSAIRRMSTSLSDDQVYPQVCLDASHDYRVFQSFRRDSRYNRILEHVSEAQGHEYLRLLSEDADLLASMDSFKANDDFGGPRVFDYPGVGAVSPTTLRYVKVLADLKRLFGSLNGMRICEIGVGYGGQCRVINAYDKPAAYRLIDIQPALTLAQRYLDNYVLPSTVSYVTMNELAPEDYDLVISNYAFTELHRAIQQPYLDKVISRSARGYITFNAITPPEFNSYTRDELVATLPDARVLDEEPLTYEGNCLIVWGDRRDG